MAKKELTKEEVMQKEISSRLSKAGFGDDEFRVELRGTPPARPNILIQIMCPLDRIITLSKAILENGITMNWIINPSTWETEDINMAVELHWAAKLNCFFTDKKSLFTSTKDEVAAMEKEKKAAQIA